MPSVRSLLTLCVAIVWLAGARPVAAPASPANKLFESDEVIDVTLDAPFVDLFAKAKTTPLASVRGTLTYGDLSIDAVEISVRGNTSKSDGECSFPKLRLKLPPRAADGSLFDGITSVKIGTHCGDLPDEQLTHFGRMANERAPLREAVVYRLMDVLNVPTLKARPARFTYVDQARRTVRSGFFLEDDRDALARVGASREVAPAQFHDAAHDFRPTDTATLAFAEALAGNFDWCLKFTPTDRYRCDARHPLWNVRAFANADGQLTPIVDDFDIAGMVTGRHAWFAHVFYAGFSAAKSPAEVEVISQVQHTRSLFSRMVLDEVRRRFVSRKAAAYAALSSADVDPDGRKTIKAYLNSFFQAIENDTAFYAPVVAKSGSGLFLDAAATRPACGASDFMPVGTLVSAPIATDGHMVRVAIVDTLWRWAPPAKCDAVHSGPVWIDRSVIASDYPDR